MNPQRREKSINKLSDQQAISIAKYMIDSLQDRVPEDSLPERREEQKKALSMLLKEYRYEADLTKLDSIQKHDDAAVGTSARNFLLVLSKTDDSHLLSKLDKWLQRPPVEGKASVESIITTVPIVLAGCISLLTVTCGARYKKGKWEYDPLRAKECIERTVGALITVVQPLVSGKKL